jgi:hypothetical protein
MQLVRDKPVELIQTYLTIWGILFFGIAIYKVESLGIDIRKIPPSQVRALLRSIAFSPFLLIPTAVVGGYAVCLLRLQRQTLTLHQKLVAGWMFLFVGLVHLAIAF